MEEMGTLPGWVSEVGDLQGVSPLQPTQVPGTVSEKQQTPRQTLGRPNARPTLTADLGESKPPQPLKANGLMRGCSRKRAPTRLPGTRGNGHCRPRAAALPPANRPGCNRLTLPAGPLPAPRLSKPAASVGEGGEDVIDARSSLQPAPRASSLPSLGVDAAGLGSAPTPSRARPQPVASSTPGLEHGGPQTPLRPVPALRLRPPHRGRLVQGKVPAKKATRRRDADETPRGARVLP